MTTKKNKTRRRKQRASDRIESIRSWIEIVTKLVEEASRPGILKVVLTSFVLAATQLFGHGETAILWSEVRAWMLQQTSSTPK
jgi:hypothetical protein